MSDSDGKLTYASSGVDIDAGNEAVRRIAAMVGTTRRPEQLDAIGGFAGMMALPSGMREPVLVSCTDGVGTKLLVAIATGRHTSVGIDLVAMCVNDLVCTGASPLFLLDYVATGRVEPGLVADVVSGIVEGCKQSNAALMGGETAELPGMYADGHYDLAAFCVGAVEREAIWSPAKVEAGDAVLALPASGLHSNGYSLARKALLDPEYRGLSWEDTLPGTERSVADELLEPTSIYVPAFRRLFELEGAPVRVAANITGGGLIENPPRAVPEGLAVELRLGDVPALPVFRAIAEAGVDDAEMLRTFNCGVGMLVFVDPTRVDEVRASLTQSDTPSYLVGEVVARDDEPVRIREAGHLFGR